MKKFQLLRLSALLFVFSASGQLSAQDNWSNVANGGIDNDYNSDFRSAHVFKGQIYVGSGNSYGNIYRSATGNTNSWSMTYSSYPTISIDALASTAEGGGFLYAAANSGCCDTSRVLRSPDGSTWTSYLSSTVFSDITKIIPFKGLGTVDDIYVIQNVSGSGMIYKSAYNSNDPLNASGMWDTALDLSVSYPGQSITAATIHNGKFYFGTDNNASVFSSADGTTFNMLVASGIGSPDNTRITALASYGGYLYAGTYNNTDGPQIWRTNNDVTWNIVQQLPVDYTWISSLTAVGGTLWVTVASDNITGEVLKSTDGVTYTVSNSNGFGYGNSGAYASITEFGNNVYWTGQNYGISKGLHTGTRSIDPTGAQIWRSCIVTPPVFSLGSDRNTCYGSSITLDAGAGYPSYSWSTGESTQTISVSNQGIYSVTVVAANGCDATDQIMLSIDPSPSITPPNTPPVVCSGTPVALFPIAVSNAYVPEPPIHQTTNVAITDNNTVSDVIAVSGMSGAFTAASLMSVTIDSLYHTYAGDLLISIVAPDGSEAALVTSQGGAADNAYFATDFRMNAPANIALATPPFNGAFVPQDNFNILTGGANGNWSLKIFDQANGDEGALKGWTLRFGTADSTLTYSWTPGATLSSTTTLNTVATPTEPTTYTLTATNIIGCSTAEPITINVAAVGFYMPAADTVCYGYNYFFNSGSPTTHWSPATGLSDTVGQYPYATLSGPITYYMVDTIGGCPVSDSIHLVYDSPMNFVFPAPQSVCYGDTVSFTVTGSGGFPPYTYQWGSVVLNTATYEQQVLTGTSFTVTVRDAAGCPSYGSTSAFAIPSTDIYGHVSYSGGAVAFSNVVLYRYEPYLTHFDSVQMVTTDASGNYHFPSVDHSQYLIEVFPAAAYAGVVPTYYTSAYVWDMGTIVVHDCAMNDTLDITMAEVSTLSGPGSLTGTVYEDYGFMRVPGDPVPGIDVKLGRNPGGQLIAQTETDPVASPTPGVYRFVNLPLNNPGEWYTIYVDIPGLGRDSTYNVVLDAGTPSYTNLDYYVDSMQIHPDIGLATQLDPNKANEHTFSVYPNPFRDAATMEYTIDHNAAVSLEVFNVLGTKVKTIARTEQMAGTYKFRMSAESDHFNPGIYFITLTVDGKASTKKVVIMK